MTNEITGTLKYARWDPHHNIVWGYIYDDIRERFSDGTWIHTAYVSFPSRDEQPKFIRTLNSYYKVEWFDET